MAKLASQFVEGVQGHMQSELQAQLDGTTKVVSTPFGLAARPGLLQPHLPAHGATIAFARALHARAQIERLAGPLEAAASEEVARLQALEDQRQELAAQLQSLMQRAANLA